MTKTDFTPTILAKKAAGLAAAELIKDGMKVGLGTGSTVAFFIEALGERYLNGLRITAASTSEQSMRQAKQYGIPMIENESILELDIVVDGADEIDHKKNMIKGGGGALLREKILASSCNEMVVIVDEMKLVEYLGIFPVPVEVASFAHLSTLKRLQESGYQGIFRLNRDQTHFITDNGNLIIDIQFTQHIIDPSKESELLKNIPGVLETGLFYNLASKVIVGYTDGYAKTKEVCNTFPNL